MESLYSFVISGRFGLKTMSSRNDCFLCNFLLKSFIIFRVVIKLSRLEAPLKMLSSATLVMWK